MSFFQSEFDDLRTSTEFTTYINETSTYQNTDQYNNKMNQYNEIEKNTIRHHICKIIMNHFNNNDKDHFNPSETKLTIYIGHISESEKNNLVSVLEKKGYIATFNDDRTRITISLPE